MPQNPLTLTRQSLYDLAWSKPMSELAKEFGISDVALAKRCRAVDVPIPYRGYWARKSAGQDPPKLPLPKYRTRTPADKPAATPTMRPKAIVRDGIEPTVRFGFPTDPPAQVTPVQTHPEELQQRIETLGLTHATTLAETCATVRRTAKVRKLRGRGPIPLTAAERPGSIIQVETSKGCLERALLLADRLIRTAEAIGWPLTDPPPPEPKQIQRNRWDPPPPESPPGPSYAQLLVDGEPIFIRIEERFKEIPRSPRPRELAREKLEYGYHAPRTESIPTGALRIVRIDTEYHWDPRRRSWYDQGSHAVETKIPKILDAFHQRAQEIKTKRAEKERLRRECEERERLRKEKEERREAHAKLRAELERQAGAWHRARFLRRYIQAARRALPDNRIEANFCTETINFLDWATDYVDQLDPLSPQPRNPDQGPEPTDYPYPDEGALKNFMLRLTGFDGRPYPKITTLADDMLEESDADEDDD